MFNYCICKEELSGLTSKVFLPSTISCAIPQRYIQVEKDISYGVAQCSCQCGCCICHYNDVICPLSQIITSSSRRKIKSLTCMHICTHQLFLMAIPFSKYNNPKNFICLDFPYKMENWKFNSLFNSAGISELFLPDVKKNLEEYIFKGFKRLRAMEIFFIFLLGRRQKYFKEEMNSSIALRERKSR